MPPTGVPALTDLTGIDAEDVEIVHLAASYAFVGGASFEGCTLRQCEFDICEFPDTTFSNCTLDRVAFRECAGPVTFTGCTFAACVWTEGQSVTRPAWVFIDCTFDPECRITQEKELSRHDNLVTDVASFASCTVAGDPTALVAGDWARSAGTP